MRNLLLVICLMTFSSSVMAQIKSTLQGIVIGRPESNTLILGKKGDDFRTAEVIKINIVNGAFSYDLEAPHSEIYELVFEDRFQKGWMNIHFYATNGSIEFELHSEDDAYKNTIIGGGGENEVVMRQIARNHSLNEKCDHVYDIMGELTEERTYSVTGLELRAKLDTASRSFKNELYKEMRILDKSGELYTAEYNVFRARIDSMYVVFDCEENKYNSENPSLIAYSDLIRDLISFQSYVESYNGEGTALEYIIERYTLLSKAYPNHIYTQRCKALIETVNEIRVGGHYIDFAAPDIDGNIVKLSSMIKGKLAIIDLWASWCAPCRATSKSYIPIYNEFKDRGFIIVGTARERNKKDMCIAIEKDGYMWTNLIELNDKNKIWEKYGINNKGGGTFMVDKNGVVLAIDPEAHEVRKILSERLD